MFLCDLLGKYIQDRGDRESVVAPIISKLKGIQER